MIEGKLESVEEMFRWKLDENILAEYQLDKINLPTVEKANKKKINQMKWNDSDVLYSFTLIYYLGLKVTNSVCFDNLFKKEKEKQHNYKLKPYSTKFLFICSRHKEFGKLNEAIEMKDFLKVYFSIGNVIPIWPGGNEARGKMGIYDCPELFFNRYSNWTDELIRYYPNAYLEKVINNDHFGGCKNGMKKEYINSFTCLKRFEYLAYNDERFYLDYLRRRNQIIEEREKLLEEYILNM